MTSVTFVHGESFEQVKDISEMHDVPRAGDFVDWPNERFQVIGVVWMVAERVHGTASAIVEMRRVR